ncbi:induced myeloid leukemia cell differentiation protein Mcl-1b [Amia ocellicauda]|uniref:induced myeloid leukemia cell differentiation protein Mcl-1b n=1 Tax=Amia ocellicauda TaxID=2972642 RepID=UPI003463E384|nr:MCL1 protein [Amia calva]
MDPLSSTFKRSSANLVVHLCYPSAQNGGTPDGYRAHSLETPTGAVETPMLRPPNPAEEELDNWVDEVDAAVAARVSKQPRKAFKGLALETRFPESSNDDGSLPSSPDTPTTDCGNMNGFTAESSGQLDRETRELIHGFLGMYCGLSRSCGRGRNKALATLTRVVESVIEKHQYAYNGMIAKVELNQKGEDMSFMRVVATNIFSDGKTNWGRIASLIAFGAVVSKHLQADGREQCVEAVAEEISSYLLADQREWLLNNKSWEGFVEFFHVEDPESTIRTALMAFAGVAGIGASLAYLIR